MNRTALLLVDIQNDFLPGGALAVPEGDAVVPVVNRLLSRYSLVAATQDWHPAGHASFASSHPGKAPFERIELDGLDQTLWPDHCVQGSSGADFAPGLDLNPVAAIFRKGMDPRVDSYSGFYDNGRRHTTGLADWLRGMGVGEVHLAGLAADICVADTARDALEEGFRTVVLEPAVRALSAEDFAAVRQSLAERGGSVRATE